MNHPADAARLAGRHRPLEAVQHLDEAAEWLAQLDQAVNEADEWCRGLRPLMPA